MTIRNCPLYGRSETGLTDRARYSVGSSAWIARILATCPEANSAKAVVFSAAINSKSSLVACSINKAASISAEGNPSVLRYKPVSLRQHTCAQYGFNSSRALGWIVPCGHVRLSTHRHPGRFELLSIRCGTEPVEDRTVV